MKRYVLVPFACLLVLTNAKSQADLRAPGKSSLASLSILLPAGEFSHSHTVGLGIGYNWSCHQYGRNDSYQIDSVKRIAFVISGGLEYYLGKKDIHTAGYPFSYGNYLYLHAMPGILYHFLKKADVGLVAGPTLGIYKSDTDFGFGVNMNIQYFIQSRLVIGPGVLFKKHEEANALWSIALRVAYCF